MEEWNGFHIKSRLWIQTKDGTYLGEGRIALLKEIDKCGSIAKAAESMKMSYKKAWTLVRSMNAQGRSPLVERQTGGNGGGGSYLSETGKKAIDLFTALKQDTQKYLDDKVKNINL